ncbi:uncharacterized protein ColSpa_00313 [Colletotrichum spaethianum]|uniref:Uncharacterized protein n=1 Tax=Colletotrichum spaethianum TaxID=700344 RepID=A0AA37NSV0_9PEZI|nr:uncharacterized protein ColSpa_00313 [Colletotrichum spaethianum]GKT40132.1 hypothetical protein ColSpa_00313 [Colletotrichum spaethianum]
MPPLKAAQLLNGDGPDLAKPFNNNDRRALLREVKRMIKKRGETDSQMTEAMKRTDKPNGAQLQQEKLLQMSVRMKAKENKFIRRQSKVLADREKLLKMDPSDARTRDVEILRTVLFKLRGEAETLESGCKQKLDGHGDDYASSVNWDSKKRDQGNSNNDNHSAPKSDLGKDKDTAAAKAHGTKTEKRKQADEYPKPSKKANNGQTSNTSPQPITEVATAADNQTSTEDSNTKMEEGAKKSKKKNKKYKPISSIETEIMEEGGKQDVVTQLQNPNDRKDHNSIVKAEADYGSTDEGGKTNKNKKSQKPNCVATVEIEQEVKDDKSKTVTGLVSKTQKHDAGPADTAKKEKMVKNKTKKKNTKTTASISADFIGNDADEQNGLKGRKTCSSHDSNSGAGALKKIKKEKRSADDIFDYMKQESHELTEPVQTTDIEQAATNEGNKKRQRKSRFITTETKSQFCHPSQDKANSSDIYDFEATSSTSKPASRGPTPTRIESPIAPVAPFSKMAGYNLLNPWAGFRRTFSIQTPEPVCAPVECNEKATKAQDGQVWVLHTAGSRKKKRNRDDHDSKSVIMTIGKVDAPTQVDQGSPTPPPKQEQKEQKKRGRPKKAQVPLMPLKPRPTTSQGPMSAPGVRASGDLIRLITPYAALLGSGERAESLSKLLAKDQELLQEEKKTWFKAMGLPLDD